MELVTTFSRAFNLVEDYAAYLCSHPKDIIPRGYLYIFQIHELDAVWIKAGDGENALIDLPNIIVR